MKQPLYNTIQNIAYNTNPHKPIMNIIYIAVYTLIGTVSYNYVAPIFDYYGGYIDGTARTITYGLLWPIPVTALACGALATAL